MSEPQPSPTEECEQLADFLRELAYYSTNLSACQEAKLRRAAELLDDHSRGLPV